MWERRKALIVVKTYPTPAKKGVEVSCTAAITEDNKWIRLFPIPFRFLGDSKKFRKYQWVEVDVQRSDDPRPESYKVNMDSFEVVSDPIPTSRGWSLRKSLLFPLRAHCLCCLRKEQQAQGFPTLGLIRPHSITKFEIAQDTERNWTPSELRVLNQYSMFDDRTPVHP